MNKITQLERAALAAHRRGDTWSAFWPTVAERIREAEPCDRQRYHRLVRRLLALLLAGDTAGQYPAGDDTEPWLADDAPGLTDSTAATQRLAPRRPIAHVKRPYPPAGTHVGARSRTLASCGVLFPPLPNGPNAAFGPTRVNVAYTSAIPPAVGTWRKLAARQARGNSRAIKDSLFCLSGFV